MSGSSGTLGRIAGATVIVAFVALGIAVDRGLPSPDPGPSPSRCDEERTACLKPWTVLIYMAADNEDMPPYAYWHLQEMEARLPDHRSASTSDAVDVVVQLDLPDHGLRRIHVVPGDVRYGEAPPESFTSPVLERLDDESVSPAQSLHAFLDWGVRNYPSRRYFVVVWGHGQGWRPESPHAGAVRYEEGAFSGGIAFDHSQRTVLDIPSLAWAMGRVSREHMGGRPFDVYASDACLMQTVEVAYELADVARYVIGSEQIEDYSGLPYRALIPELWRLNDGAAVAAAVPPIYAHAVRHGQYVRRAPGARQHFTVASVRTSALGRELVPALDELGAALQAYNDEDPSFHALQLMVLLDRGIPDFLFGARDLGTLARVIEADLERTGPTATTQRVQRAIAELRAAMRRAVVAFAAGDAYDTPSWQGMAGISVWLPHRRTEYDARIESFASSRFFADAPRWRPWIESALSPLPLDAQRP